MGTTPSTAAQGYSHAPTGRKRSSIDARSGPRLPGGAGSPIPKCSYAICPIGLPFFHRLNPSMRRVASSQLPGFGVPPLRRGRGSSQGPPRPSPSAWRRPSFYKNRSLWPCKKPRHHQQSFPNVGHNSPRPQDFRDQHAREPTIASCTCFLCLQSSRLAIPRHSPPTPTYDSPQQSVRLESLHQPATRSARSGQDGRISSCTRIPSPTLPAWANARHPGSTPGS